MHLFLFTLMMMNLTFITAMLFTMKWLALICFVLNCTLRTWWVRNQSDSHGFQISMISHRKMLDFASVTLHIYHTLTTTCLMKKKGFKKCKPPKFHFSSISFMKSFITQNKTLLTVFLVD